MDKITRERIKQQAAQGKATAAATKEPKTEVFHVPCGHSTKRGKPDEVCGPCKDKAARDEAAKRRAERPAPKPAGNNDKSRLPDCSQYHKHYWASKREWVVTLSIPNPLTGEPHKFTATGSGSIKTELKVDAMYREWLKAQQPKEEPGDVAHRTLP